MKANLTIIEKQRKKIGITMSELSRRVGVKSHQTLRFWLRSGNQINSDLARVTRLCDELNINIKDVIK